MSRIGRTTFAARALSATQTPTGKATIIVSTSATRTCDAVSIALFHSPTTPITDSIANVVSAGRQPDSSSAISVRPATITGHGVWMKKLRKGSRPYWTRWFPIQLVIEKTNVAGFST